MSLQPPPLLRIASVDPTAKAGFLLWILAALVALGLPIFFANASVGTALIFAAFPFAIGSALFLPRLAFVRRMFREGELVEGVIGRREDCHGRNAGTRLTVSHGERDRTIECQSRSPTLDQRFAEGVTVRLLVDPGRPDRTIVVDLYE